MANIGRALLPEYFAPNPPSLPRNELRLRVNSVAMLIIETSASTEASVTAVLGC